VYMYHLLPGILRGEERSNIVNVSPAAEFRRKPTCASATCPDIPGLLG